MSDRENRIRAELPAVVERWLKENGLYGEGERVEILIKFVPRPPVVGVRVSESGSRRGKWRPKTLPDPITEEDWKIILGVPMSEDHRAILLKFRELGNYVPRLDNVTPYPWELENINSAFRKAGVMYRVRLVGGKGAWDGRPAKVVKVE